MNAMPAGLPAPAPLSIEGVITTAAPIAGTNLTRIVVVVPGDLASVGLHLDAVVVISERPGVQAIPAWRERIAAFEAAAVEGGAA